MAGGRTSCRDLDFGRRAVRFCLGIWRGLAVVVLVAMRIVPTHAADWVEPPYNPAVGSRWMIESADRTAETKPDGGERSTIFNGRAEITIDEKTDKGFRISYVARQISVEGTSPHVPVMRIYCKMLENILIRATTDAAGKPIRIDNLDMVKTEMRTAMARLLKSAENSPRELRPLGLMMSDLFTMNAEDAAPFFLEEMVALAKSQNTRMKKGDVLRSTGPADNPLGPTLQSKTSFTLNDTNVEKRTAIYHEVRALDEGSVKDFVTAHSRAVLGKSMRRGDTETTREPDEIDNDVAGRKRLFCRGEWHDARRRRNVSDYGKHRGRGCHEDQIQDDQGDSRRREFRRNR